jgi:hypothetical protein
MRASPTFRIHIRHFGVWRAAVALLLAVALGVQSAWLIGRAGDTPLAALLAIAAVDVLLVVAASSALRVAPVELHWDTRRWHLANDPGNLTIALDLGPWMLLRFDHDARPPGAPRTAWLPVQRMGLEAQWHGLRCAVYCARPALGTDAGPNSAAGPESQE